MASMDQLVSQIAATVAEKLAQEAGRIPLGVSNRHLHVSEEDLRILFGDGATLDCWKPLRQPGQFASSRTVLAAGPKGSLNGIRILGPCRSRTQLELSATDCRTVGIPPVVRESGDIDGTPGITLVGPRGAVTLKEGVIVAKRHLHLPTDQAEAWGLRDRQQVGIRFHGPREAQLGAVVVRVSDAFLPELHLDTDEVNALLICQEDIHVDDVVR